MSWTRLPIENEDGVRITILKKTVTLVLLSSSRTALRWGSTDRVRLELGDGEHAGWVRMTLDPDGIEGEISSGHLAFSLPRSTLPDLLEARNAPLVWRAVDGAIEVRLPTVNASARPKPTLRSVPHSEPVAEVHPIAVPAEYAEFHANTWVNGIELVFLSDGTCLVNRRIVPIAEVRAEVKRQLEAA